MRTLIINKFLYANGGSETYIFKLGEQLQKMGHEVQYFGMEHKGRCVGNRVNAYTSDMDFHGGSKLSKLTYPIKTIYSKEARVQLRKVLDDFQPDVCHLNNFNYQLTPSMILEIVKWRKYNLLLRPYISVPASHHHKLFEACSVNQQHHFSQVCDVASSAYLPHSGKSRLGCEAGTVMKFVFIPFVYCWRAGTD